MGQRLTEDVDFPRKLKITFKDSKDSIHGANNLLLIASSGEVMISVEDEATLEAVTAFGEWGGPQNRTVTVTLRDDYEIQSFAEELRGFLECFEFIR